MKELDPHSSEVCSGGWCPGPTLVSGKSPASCRPCLLPAALPARAAFPGPSAGRGRGGRGGGRKQAGAAAWGGTGASLLGAVIWKPSAGREGGSRLPGATHAGRPRGDPAGRPAASLACPGVPAVPCLPLGSPHPDLPTVLGSPHLSLAERMHPQELCAGGWGNPPTHFCARQHCSHHLLHAYHPFGGLVL